MWLSEMWLIFAVCATTIGSGMAEKDTAFEMAASSVRFGVGVTREVGMDLKDLGVIRALVVTDPVVAKLRPVQIVMESLADAGIAGDAIQSRARRAERCVIPRRDRVRSRRRLPDVRRRRRRIDNRYGESRESLHNVSAGRFSRLRESADRQRPPDPRTAQAEIGRASCRERV